MKVPHILVMVLLVQVLSLSACGMTTPSSVVQATTMPITTPITPTSMQGAVEEPLYLALIWHHHQPMYYKDADGVYTRPWVRVHSTKDYYDMADMVANYPNFHVTFNITPVLIQQIKDYVAGAKDQYWVLAEQPASNLTQEEKLFILERFFDANWDRVIGRFPRYEELLQKRGGTDDEALDVALKAFTEQDFRDLQVWFNLAWFDPAFLDEEPLKSLVEKGENFSEDDKAVIFAQVRKVMEEVLPLYMRLQESGQVELMTTPYAHPILPLLYDSNLAAIGNPRAELPERYSSIVDAVAQLRKSVETYEETFREAPRGLWPAEGAVAQEIVPLVYNAGFQWMASGEHVLANSLGIDAFTRDAQDTVQEADMLYRPYFVEGPEGGPLKGGPVVIVFRDVWISDKIGFTYSGMSGQAAADDFMQRLENIRARLQEEGAVGPHLVSVILDGENAWEYYQNDSKEFFGALYRNLSESTTIKAVTPSEYLVMFPDLRTLDYLFPGAWFSPNYDTWIGESEETTAWEYLRRVRRDLAEYDLSKLRTPPSEEALIQALDYMYLAEGSDWFWWYGADQDSGNDSYFDEGFRALLTGVYQVLEETAPPYLKVPILSNHPVSPETHFGGVFSAEIDGQAGPEEWSLAAYYPVADVTQVGEDDFATAFYYGLDEENLYFRVDAISDWGSIPDAFVSVYISSPRLHTKLGLTRRSEDSLVPYLLGFGATSLVEVDMDDVLAMQYVSGKTRWKAGEVAPEVAVVGNVLELGLPLSVLGELEAGDELRLVAVISSGTRDLQSLPSSGPAQVILPDIGKITYILELDDPVGDDYGSGTYTYPTDSVFTAGVFDLATFKIGYDENDLIFKFTFNGSIPNPWNSPNNLALQTIDVYVDKDPGEGTGARMFLPGRNAALEVGNGWEFAIWAEGWTPQIVVPDPATLEPKQLASADYKIIVDPSSSIVTLRVPRDVFGEGDPAQWGYVGVVLSQEGFPSAGVWRVRDVLAVSQQWRFGGGLEDTNHTRIVDLAWPEGEIPTQEEFLSSYPSSSEPIDELSVDDFPQIQLVIP